MVVAWHCVIRLRQAVWLSQCLGKEVWRVWRDLGLVLCREGWLGVIVCLIFLCVLGGRKCGFIVSPHALRFLLIVWVLVVTFLPLVSVVLGRSLVVRVCLSLSL